MKKVFFLFSSIAIMITVSSCSSTSKSFSNFLTTHNFQESHVLDISTGKTRLYASIDSLYDYSKVAELCDTADITFHISRGKIEISADCTGAGESLIPIVKNLFSRIKFKK